MKSPQLFDVDHWKRIDALLDVALSLPPAERTRLLDTLPAELVAHRPTIEQMLLRAVVETDEFMQKPVSAATLEAAAGNMHGDRPGATVGPYRLIRELGVGGMGTVWLAERIDDAPRRRVALKLPKAAWSPGVAERLRRESAILASLEHPNIARLYDAGMTAEERPYLAMENVEGQPITVYATEATLPTEARLRLFLQVIKAVSHAHARLIVHRDLKPSNILVDVAGGVHLLDFGVAKLLTAEAAAATQLTQATGRALTPDYASPEQIRGEQITVASDVYSLGVVLYELLSGQRPYKLKRDSAAALEEAITEADVPLASRQPGLERKLVRALRGDLDTILAKALGKQVQQRYSSAEAFAADIERHLAGEPVLARPSSFSYRLGKALQRHRGAAVSAAIIALVVAGGAGSSLYQARLADRQAQQAASERDRALRELVFAEASEEFMRFLLSEQSAKPISSQELLARAERTIEAQFADDASLRTRMQLLIADLYGEVDNFIAAETVLRRAQVSAEKAADASLLAQVECTLGGLMPSAGKAGESDALFARALQRIATLDRGDTTAREVCHIQRTVYFRNKGDAAASLVDAEAALAIIGTPRPGKRALAADLRASIADVEGLRGDFAGAVAKYEVAIGELAAMGRTNTSAAMHLTNNLMVYLTRVGQLRRAEALYLDVQQRTKGGSPDFGLDANYARVLVDSGRAPAAVPVLLRVIAAKEKIGDRRGAAFAWLGLAGAQCAVGDARGCGLALAQARSKLPGVVPPGHSSYATMNYLDGFIARLQGRDALAQQRFEQALQQYNTVKEVHPTKVRVLIGLSQLALQRDDHAAARDHAAAAIAAARSIAKGFDSSEWIGSALRAMGQVQLAAGDAAAARATLTEARDHLVQSVGEQAPAARETVRLLASL